MGGTEAALVGGLFSAASTAYAARQKRKQSERDRALELALAKFNAERENQAASTSLTTNALQSIQDLIGKSFLK
jgi:hypothetical protein